MRILQIRFKNLNSLSGEWFIDLTHPSYVSEGIFTITGPTGSGKTTILDAICLALYGETPRLSNITKTDNGIMSRRSGECFAEVTFENESGRYRCHWYQHRANHRADGALQGAKHEIANADTGEIIESGLKATESAIERITGMNFDRFTRSMLLAQGRFDTFLKAAAGERAPILEQITGTGIYREISLRVHELMSAEKKKLEVLRAEMGGISLLEPQEEEALQEKAKTCQTEENALGIQINENGQAIQWLTKLENLQKEMGELTQKESALQEKMEAFRPQREKLDAAQRAATLDGQYAALEAIRKQQTHDTDSLESEKKALTVQKDALEKVANALEEAQNTAKEYRQRKENAQALWQEVRALDQTIDGIKNQLDEINGQYSKKEDEAKKDEQKQKEFAQQLARFDQSLTTIKSYLAEHGKDDELEGHLGALLEQNAHLDAMEKDSTDKANAFEKAKKALHKREVEHERQKADTAKWRQRLQEAEKTLTEGKIQLEKMLRGQTLREWRLQKDLLVEKLRNIELLSSLSEHRSRLQDGKPCPLCGALHHPYMQDAIPLPDETFEQIAAINALMAQAEAQEAANATYQETVNQVRDALNAAEKEEMASLNRKQIAKELLDERTLALQKAKEEKDSYRTHLLQRLGQLGTKAKTDADISVLIGELQNRLETWRHQNQEKAALEKQRTDMETQMKLLAANLENRQKSKQELSQKQQSLQNELTDKQKARISLFGEKNPAEEEVRLNRQIDEAQTQEKASREKYDISHQKAQATETRIKTLIDNLEKRTPELEKAESAFRNDCQAKGFYEEAAFLAARVPDKERIALEKKAREQDEERTALSARKKDRQEQLTTETAKALTALSMTELTEQSARLNAAMKEVRDTMAGIRNRLQDNEQAKKRILAKQQLIDLQQQTYDRWNMLHALIGSNDGKKYPNFAQGLTFELMIAYANAQLQKMSDRYLLVRNKDKPLELDVIDNYQAGEIRSTRNLSGGECFIVSLSLALGLSSMASRHVRVDSLFLDEGFGTLDDNALETALDTLASLQQNGKLISIISHVSALKDRIRTQIKVIPGKGGKSRIEGPGCSRQSYA